jgi:hypothetical protein
VCCQRIDWGLLSGTSLEISTVHPKVIKPLRETLRHGMQRVQFLYRAVLCAVKNRSEAKPGAARPGAKKRSTRLLRSIYHRSVIDDLHFMLSYKISRIYKLYIYHLDTDV